MSDTFKKIDHDFAINMENYIRALHEEFLKEKSVWNEEYFQGSENETRHPARILLQVAEGLSERIRRNNEMIKNKSERP